TTPLPMTLLTPGVRIPEGIRCRAKLSPFGSTTVCPALLPPWYRTTHWTSPPSRSVAFPLPSSPHWAPISTIAGIGCSPPLFRSRPPGGGCRGSILVDRPRPRTNCAGPAGRDPAATDLQVPIPWPPCCCAADRPPFP